MKPLILFITLCLTPLTSLNADSFWIENTDITPENAVHVDDENASSHLICRAQHEGQTFSGEVHENKCLILYNNTAIKKDRFDILVNNIEKFKSYKPNYVVYVPKEGNTPAEDDEHLEVYYSFKYRISNEKIHGKLSYNNYYYLSYTGKFDFYTDIFHETPESRKSSPVINRLSNPEIHYRAYLSSKNQKQGLFSKYIDVAFGHESNGQTLDINSYEAYRDNTQDGVHFVDYISRGWDYLSAEYKYEYNKKNCDAEYFSCLYGHIYVRRFYNYGPLQKGIDDDIFWPDTVNTDAKIKYFDGIRLILGKEFPSEPGSPPDKGYWINYRTGINKTGKYNSFTLNVRHDVGLFGFKLPVYLRYFNGYGKELTTYHERDREISIGLQFR